MTAGKDMHLRIYDEETQKLRTSMHSNGYMAPGHSNRVYCVKYHPQDERLLLSGGWDNTVQIYDVRAGVPAFSLFGASLSGESLDIHGDTLITGSYRGKDAL